MEKIVKFLKKVKVFLSETAMRLFGPLLVILGIDGAEEQAEELSNLIILIFGALITVVTNIDLVTTKAVKAWNKIKSWFNKEKKE